MALSRTKTSLPAAVLIGSIVAAAGLQAQVVVPVGTEFQVNTYTTNGQSRPDVCGTADGRFVVVWSGAEGDPLRNNVYAQRYTSDGLPAGTEFQVNTYTSEQQELASVCCAANGDFFVAWQQQRGQDGNRDGVFGQRFASDGQFLGTEFQVNTYTTNNQAYPAACCDAGGNFVVAWQSYMQDGNLPGIFAQRFASSGAFIGTEFQVNTYTVSRQRLPAACCGPGGDFVLAWQSQEQDGNGNGIFAQRFLSTGAFQGTEFQANTYTVDAQEAPALCCAGDGAFVVAWESRGQDGSGDGIFGQRFAGDGAPRGGEFRVNLGTASSQYDPSLCCDDGAFVVTWSSQRAGGGYDIVARRFAQDGGALSGDVTVSQNPDGYALNPAVACREDGGFVVAWSAVSDGSELGIFGRLFALRAVTITGTPALSWGGLGLAIAVLVGAGLRRLRARS